MAGWSSHSGQDPNSWGPRKIFLTLVPSLYIYIFILFYCCSLYYSFFISPQFSRSVVSDLLQSHGVQCTRLPCHQQLREPIQTPVYWVGDAIQPFHPFLWPSPPAFSLSEHQVRCKWVSSSHVAKVLEFQLLHQSFQRIFRTDLLWDGLVGSPCSPRDSQESSPTPQYKSFNYSVLSFLYSPTLTSIDDYWKNHILD